jgi:hypothetical protein
MKQDSNSKGHQFTHLAEGTDTFRQNHSHMRVVAPESNIDNCQFQPYLVFRNMEQGSGRKASLQKCFDSNNGIDYDDLCAVEP